MRNSRRWACGCEELTDSSESQAAFYSMLASYGRATRMSNVGAESRTRGTATERRDLGRRLLPPCHRSWPRARNRVMKNNQSLAKKAKAGTKVLEDDLPRDQGFVRPTVLFLTPMRNIAGRAIMRLLDLCPAAHGRNDSVNKLERIEEDFLAYEGSDSENEDEEPSGKKSSSRSCPRITRRCSRETRMITFDSD